MVTWDFCAQPELWSLLKGDAIKDSGPLAGHAFIESHS